MNRLAHVLSYLRSPEGIAMSQKWNAEMRQAASKNVLRYRTARLVRDIGFKNIQSWRQRINSALFKKWRREGAEDRQMDKVIPKLCGCGREELRKHLEGLFKEGMVWENHGRVGWHIDHKVPVWEFDLESEEGLLECNHWSNLQPLWWYENRAKGILEARWSREQQKLGGKRTMREEMLGAGITAEELDSVGI